MYKPDNDYRLKYVSRQQWLVQSIYQLTLTSWLSWYMDLDFLILATILNAVLTTSIL